MNNELTGSRSTRCLRVSTAAWRSVGCNHNAAHILVRITPETDKKEILMYVQETKHQSRTKNHSYEDTDIEGQQVELQKIDRHPQHICKEELKEYITKLKVDSIDDP